MKEINKNKKFKKGFTLLEMLVVVLIIGILAAIALPQYRYAVAKSKLAKVKSNTQVLAESVRRYLLINDSMPEKLSDLDITIEGVDRYNTGKSVWLDNNEVSYSIEPYSGYIYIRGIVYIQKVQIQLRHLIYKENRRDILSIAVDTLNTNHISSKLAAKETNNNNPIVFDFYMEYGYKN